MYISLGVQTSYDTTGSASWTSGGGNSPVMVVAQQEVVPQAAALGPVWGSAFGAAALGARAIRLWLGAPRQKACPYPPEELVLVQALDQVPAEQVNSCMSISFIQQQTHVHLTLQA